MTRRALLAAAMAVATLSAVACEEENRIEKPGSDLGLIGKTFLLESTEGDALVDGSSISIHFSEDRDGGLWFGLYTDCNSLDGAFTLSEGFMDVGMVSKTDMWCSDELSEQETWMYAFMTSNPALGHGDDRVTLATDDATLVFLDREVATPDRVLDQETWVIDSIIEGESMSTVMRKDEPRLWFLEDGTFAISSACMDGGGRYTTDGDQMVLSEVSIDAVACEDPSAMAFDEHVQDVLADGALTHEIDSSRLTIARGDAGISAKAE